MHFHGLHQEGDKHFLTLTDEGKRQTIEVTAEERLTIEVGMGRWYRRGFQSGRQGVWEYSPPLVWGCYAEAYARGRETGLRERERKTI